MEEIFNTLLLIIKILSGLISLAFGAIFLYYAEKSGYWDDLRKWSGYRKVEKKDTIQSTNKIETEWMEVKARLEIGDEASTKLAVIEADKLVDNLLKTMGYIGNSMGDRLKLLERSNFESLDDLWRVHKVRNKIVHDPDFHIDTEEAKKTIETYEKVLRQLKAL
jgi:hypothetical protein